MLNAIETRIEQQKDLQPLNTLAVSSVAEYFIRIESLDSLAAAVAWAQEKQLTAHILSGGSNVLLAPFISGLVIQVGLRGVTVARDEAQKFAQVTLGAGENWHEMVTYCVEQGLYGLENLALIPGFVGAAPVQNIGAYGVELDQVLDSVTAWDLADQRVVTLNKDECAFGYRDSVFKTPFGKRYVITSVTLCLSLIDTPSFDYPALQQVLKNVLHPTAKDVYDAVIAVRSSKLPDPSQIPNVGSFFKNPVVSQGLYQRLLQRYPDMPAYKIDSQHVKIPAAWLIDQAGWKGKTHDGITMHAQQALVLTNPLSLSLETVMACAHAVQKDVAVKFEIGLEIEPQGF